MRLARASRSSLACFLPGLAGWLRCCSLLRGPRRVTGLRAGAGGACIQGPNQPLTLSLEVVHASRMLACLHGRPRYLVGPMPQRFFHAPCSPSHRPPSPLQPHKLQDTSCDLLPASSLLGTLSSQKPFLTALGSTTQAHLCPLPALLLLLPTAGLSRWPLAMLPLLLPGLRALLYYLAPSPCSWAC